MNPWYLIGWFIALGPIYWFGPLGYNEMTIIKTFLLLAFFLTLTVIFIARREKITFPSPFGFHAFLLLLTLLIISGLKSSSIQDVFSELFKYILPFIVMWLVYNASFYYDDFEVISSKILLLIPFVSILIITSSFFKFPNWTSPFYDPDLAFLTLDFTGFGSTRTAWSNGMALAYPLLIIGGYSFFHKKKIFLCLVISLMFLSVFLPGGRGGIISILITTFFALRLYIPNKSLSTLMTSIFTLVVIIGIFTIGADSRALRKLPSDNDLNSLSSGRLDGYLIGFDIIKDNLLVGLGINNVNLKNYGESVESIHNFWISSAAEYGIFFPLILACLFLKVIFHYHRKRNYLKNEYKANFYVIIAGIFMSNLEPSGFIGAFQQQAIFWACLGRLIYLMKYRTSCSKDNIKPMQ
ncbi:O-antigen ligase family protein [Psychrobacter pacificensis]|uniref:O-antigen ligase family protein n=1 Tax=Psychrobacter pacificensis TaxID=112002 RepID=UPI003D288E5B